MSRPGPNVSQPTRNTLKDINKVQMDALNDKDARLSKANMRFIEAQKEGFSFREQMVKAQLEVRGLRTKAELKAKQEVKSLKAERQSLQG